jgi:hypothetical protein
MAGLTRDETTPALDVPPPSEPRRYDWDDDPHVAARYDRLYWTDRDEDS